jgi:hypothetical protein
MIINLTYSFEERYQIKDVSATLQTKNDRYFYAIKSISTSPCKDERY